jgi:hypothetical protein
MDTPPPFPVSEEAKWPLRTLLIYGYFGSKSPEGHRYHQRCCIAFLIAGITLFAWLVGTVRLSRFADVDRLTGIIAHLIGGGLFSFIAWSFWKYLWELDELARGIQFQAITLTYLTGLGAAGFVAALAPALEPWRFDPLLAYMFLEPVRAFWLWTIAKRYQ